VHDRVVGTVGAHARVLLAIDNLLRLAGAGSVVILCVVTGENARAFPGLYRWAHQRRLPLFAHPPYPTIESGRDRFFSAAVSQREIAESLVDLYREEGSRALPVQGLAPCVPFRAMQRAGVSAARWLVFAE